MPGGVRANQTEILGAAVRTQSGWKGSAPRGTPCVCPPPRAPTLLELAVAPAMLELARVAVTELPVAEPAHVPGPRV